MNAARMYRRLEGQVYENVRIWILIIYDVYSSVYYLNFKVCKFFPSGGG